MRRTLERIYRVLLAMQGAYICLLCLLFFVTLPSGLARDLYLGIPAILAVLSLCVGLFFLFAQFQPQWMARPSGFLEALGPIIILTITPILFLIPSMGVVVNLGLPEPLSKSVAVTAAAGNFLLSGLAWWLAVSLMIVRRPPPAPPQHSPIIAASRRDPGDYRALRKARM